MAGACSCFPAFLIDYYLSLAGAGFADAIHQYFQQPRVLADGLGKGELHLGESLGQALPGRGQIAPDMNSRGKKMRQQHHALSAGSDAL